MTPIILTNCVDIPEFIKEWPEFRTLNDCSRLKFQIGMEVAIRHNQEDFRIRIDELPDDTTIIGPVLTPSQYTYFKQPFTTLDVVQFERKNVFDVYDVDRWGVKL